LSLTLSRLKVSGERLDPRLQTCAQLFDLCLSLLELLLQRLDPSLGVLKLARQSFIFLNRGLELRGELLHPGSPLPCSWSTLLGWGLSLSIPALLSRRLGGGVPVLLGEPDPRAKGSCKEGCSETEFGGAYGQDTEVLGQSVHRLDPFFSRCVWQLLAGNFSYFTPPTPASDVQHLQTTRLETVYRKRGMVVPQKERSISGNLGTRRVQNVQRRMA
jgi:hypothetical protein